MAEQIISDRTERAPGSFDGTELIHILPTSEGVSYKSAVGTAASKNVTTSATDTTAGRVIKRGDAFPDGLHIGGAAAANLLDDYEEGTWTPGFSSASGGESITYTKQVGNYVKNGNSVTASGEITVDTVSGGSGDVYLSGFPFPSLASARRSGVLSIGLAAEWDTQQPETGEFGFSETRMLLRWRDTATTVPRLSWGNVKSGTRIVFGVTYITQ